MEVPDQRLPAANFADLALPLFDQLFNFAHWLAQDRYEAEDLSVAKWLEERQRRATLSILLVVNPTGDLSGAAAEGARIQALFEKLRPAVNIREMVEDQARKHEIIACLASGEYDVIHYAGHAYFDPIDPSRLVGFVCSHRGTAQEAVGRGIRRYR